MVCVIPVSRAEMYAFQYLVLRYDEYHLEDCYGVSQYGALFLSHLDIFTSDLGLS